MEQQKAAQVEAVESSRRKRTRPARRAPRELIEQDEQLRSRIGSASLIDLRDRTCPGCNLALPLKVLHDGLRSGAPFCCPLCNWLLVCLDPARLSA